MTTTLHQSALNLVDGEWQSAPSSSRCATPRTSASWSATVPSMDAPGVHAAFEAAERAAADLAEHQPGGPRPRPAARGPAAA